MLTKAHIKNFKSLRDVTLIFGRNNVLVGPNMSGKSNIIDFFRFVRDLISERPEGIHGAFNSRNFSSPSALLDIAWKGADDPVISFEIEGTLDRKGLPSTWTYAVSFLGNLTWGRVSVHEEALTLKDTAGISVLITTKEQKRFICGPDGSREIPDPNRLALDYEFPNWDGSWLKKSISSWRFYNLVPSFMRKPNASAAPTTLSTSGDNLSSWLMLLQTAHSETFHRIRSVVKDILPEISSIFTNPTPQSTVYLSSEEPHLHRPITVAEMSDGELILIALLSLLYAPPKLKGDACFIEEPENHLHPRVLAVLADLLRQVQQESSVGQLFLTSHSPYLLDKFSLDELLVLGKKDGATYVTRPADKAELKNLITDEEIGLGDLFYSGALSDA